MLLLHAAWIVGNDVEPGRLGLWAETSERGPKRRPAGRGRPRPHPSAAAFAVIAGPLAEIAPVAVVESAQRERLVAYLPSADGRPVPSPALEVDDGAAEPTSLAPWNVDALTFDAAAACDLLAALDEGLLPRGLEIGDDVRFWTVAGQVALDLIAGQRFEPTLQTDGQRFLARWRMALDQQDLERVRGLARRMPGSCRALSADAELTPPAGVVLHDFLDAAADAIARRALGPLRPDRRAARRRPPLAWIDALDSAPIVPGNPAALESFARAFHAWTEAGRPPAEVEPLRVCFRLEPPEGHAASWRLRYLLQAADDPSLLVPARQAWRQHGATARFLNRTFAEPQERLLAGLGRASRLYPPIGASLASPAPDSCSLTTTQAYEFVQEHALLLQASGFGVLVPGFDTTLGVRVRLRSKSASQPAASAFGWEAVVSFDWELALGDEPLSREEFEVLAHLKEPLVQVRGRWIALRPDQVQRALAFLERESREELSLPEAMRLALAPDADPVLPGAGLPVVEVTTEGWLDDLLRRLRVASSESTLRQAQGERAQGERAAQGEGAAHGEPVEPSTGVGPAEIAEPPGFVGELRPYQRVGVAWLEELRRVGLGACLADDMGLGKTIQLIALLLHGRHNGDPRPPALLVCPTSVVSNWRRELERFAPGLRVLVHHGVERSREGLAGAAAQHDVVLSTYALLHRDEEQLGGVEWGAVVLDEAQNIKNPGTRAAQVARELRAQWRAALTGTPVENRLSDLWSIFQFLNPGYLGSAEAFRRRYSLRIERAHDPRATAELQRLVSPFILRRLKTDRAIIADLPEKQEMKVYCTLTREQATLYQAVLDDAMAAIEEAEGIKRRGQILATLTKLKQVCDHPALFLHDGSPLASRSGKLERLAEMLEEVAAVGERALIFTQYAQMGKLLHRHLAETFGSEALFLHGGTPAPERERLVARFQREGPGPGVFILSLKAGGTGLNLTQANHVFHFDRWWNPAVENQATDRAFRIGQRRDVQVHKFLCAGTFEETLDDLIERKVALAQTIVGTSEAWITELGTDELRELFALRRDLVVEA